MSIGPTHEKTWDDVEREIFTLEEIAESDVRIAIMYKLVKARHERGITQRKLEEMTGIKQSVIASLETGQTSPTLETMMEILVPLGKTLIMADFSPEQMPTKKSVAAHFAERTLDN